MFFLENYAYDGNFFHYFFFGSNKIFNQGLISFQLSSPLFLENMYFENNYNGRMIY